jgi:magnesium transporter
MVGERWIDLLDPDQAELRRHLPPNIHDRALEQLLEPVRHEDEPRPKLESQGDYIFGIFLVVVPEPEEDTIYYQEVDLVLTRDVLVTVRKTPQGRPPYDPSGAREACREEDPPGKVVYHLVDDIAERYLDLIDALDDEIDELDDHVEDWPAQRIRDRLSALRHDLLHIRRTLAPTRDAVRGIVDNRVELEGKVELFPHELELSFGDAYDKLLRAADGLELSRDLIGSVRDYHQAKISNDQNEVMKKLTAIASILLVPTLIVGIYGQNFREIPELHWGFGYAWSWGLIVISTAVQVAYFRRKGWL